MENFKEKYEQALKVAQRFYNNSAAITKKGLEDIFPELKESEDEKIRKWLIRDMQNCLEEGAYDGEDIAYAQKAIAWIEKQKPEWSEEDIAIIGRIRSIIEKYAFSQSAVDVNGELCEREYIELDNWLKSLKERYCPQSYWKPSDKQLDALHDAAVYVDKSMFPYPKGILMKMYKQLKKLREE